jgi:hypothetical protein
VNILEYKYYSGIWKSAMIQLNHYDPKLRIPEVKYLIDYLANQRSKYMGMHMRASMRFKFVLAWLSVVEYV